MEREKQESNAARPFSSLEQCCVQLCGLLDLVDRTPSFARGFRCCSLERVRGVLHTCAFPLSLLLASGARRVRDSPSVLV